MLEVRITKLDERAIIPKYETQKATAMDLTTIEDMEVPPHTFVALRTGLGFGIPEDYAMFIFSRSSTYKKFGVILANGVGIIDADYSGPEDEVHIAVVNHGNQPIHIKAGSRVAQMMIIPRPKITFTEGPAENINRGGFGSTGGHGA